MAVKKEDLKPTEEIKPEKIEKIEEKVEKKVDEAKEKIEKKTGSRENLIGELADPKINEEFNYGDWAKKFDEKLDRILASSKPPEKTESETPPPTEKQKAAWYDRELF